MTSPAALAASPAPAPVPAPVPASAPGAPLVTFFRMIDQARLPLRADRSAAGSLPTRAFRYCDAISTATGLGWYLFPPMDFELYFDGNEVFATWEGVGGEGGGGWFPLSIIQFPGFQARFDAAAPEAIRGYSPPFLGCMQEPGIVQIWSGLTLRTAPGWSALVRPCANLPGNRGFEVFEGIIETDHWFGPLFSNLRLTRTHSPIRFSREWPVAMVQVLPQVAYAEETLKSAEAVDRLEAFQPADWQAYADTVVRRATQPVRQPGAYAVENRKRRKGGDKGTGNGTDGGEAKAGVKAGVKAGDKAGVKAGVEAGAKAAGGGATCPYAAGAAAA